MMRARVVALIAMIFATTASAAGPFWSPTAADIARVEATIKLPNQRPLTAYVRVYAGAIENGRIVISGELVLPAAQGEWNKPPGATVRKELPLVPFDGGCSVITLKFDARTRRMLWIRCNGIG